jgi:hypothetical protein
MSLDLILDQIKAQADNIAPLGSSFKFILDEQAIHIDGSGDSNVVTT